MPHVSLAHRIVNESAACRLLPIAVHGDAASRQAIAGQHPTDPTRSLREMPGR
jgi:hypothetical protein